MPLKVCLCVVYFDQCLSAAHPKRWSKSSFLMFLTPKSLKKEKKARNLQQNLTLISPDLEVKVRQNIEKCICQFNSVSNIQPFGQIRPFSFVFIWPSG